MAASAHKWSFFIAHARADLGTARQLYDRLAPHAPTFLGSVCIELGADWDLELARAQREALISVVLVSSHTERAYYQREEIAAAIELARTEGKKHRVVPVFLDAKAAASADVPYGLRLKHGLKLTDEFGLDEAARKLLDFLRRVQDEAPKGPSREKQLPPPPFSLRPWWLAGR